MMAADMERQNLPSKNAPKRKRTDTNSGAEPTSTTIKRPRLNNSLGLLYDEEMKALESIEARCDVQLQSVISSSKIRLRVTSVLRHLTPSTSTQPPPAEPAADKTTDTTIATTASKPRVAILRAKFTEVNKMVTMIEIAKREIEKEQPESVSEGATGESSRTSERGHWFQYTALGEELKQRSRPDTNATKTPDKSKKDDNENEEEDEEDDFEVMKTRFERAIESQPLVKKIPVMSIFLSRSPIPELKEQFGEQTNAPSV